MKASTTSESQAPSLVEIVSIVTRKGQVTVPAEFRRSLGLKEGDRVALSLGERGRGEVRLRPVRSVAELTHGAVAPRKRPEDFQALRRQFEESTSEEGTAEVVCPGRA